jgi:hypothetical protein
MNARVPPPRLSLFLARNAPVGAVLRRGPTRWVELVRWDTRNDSIERGAWFRGRVYSRRSDLSPDGTRLIYFASKFSARSVKDPEYTYAWTAVSKVPYFTALALWPKGDCWWGGGLFTDDDAVFLNHRPHEAVPHPAHRPDRLRVEPNPAAHGEDEPLYGRRLSRDGWQLRQELRIEQRGWRYATLQPELRERVHPDGRLVIQMERRLEGFSWSEVFRLGATSGATTSQLQGAEWADWDQQGDLVLLRQGGIWRARLSGLRVIREDLVQDLRGDRPEPRASPPWAKRW